MVSRVSVATLLVFCAIVPAARAQEPPPPIPPVVLDLRGSFTRFPTADTELAASRGLNTTELPRPALGGDVGLHLYPLRFRAVTFGIGGQFSYLRGRHTPSATGQDVFLRPVTERFVTGGAQLSLNFGNGNGWSYLSGGIGRSVWQVIPGTADATAADNERLKTINYGGGARWFMKKRLAFSFDVRLHAVNPGSPFSGFPGSPRTTLMVISAGASLKLR